MFGRQSSRISRKCCHRIIARKSTQGIAAHGITANIVSSCPLYLSAIGSDVFSLPTTANDRMTSCSLSASRRRGCYTFRQCKGKIPLSASPNGENCAPPQPKAECDTCHFGASARPKLAITLGGGYF
jgi:hypothetical protein